MLHGPGLLAMLSRVRFFFLGGLACALLSGCFLDRSGIVGGEPDAGRADAGASDAGRDDAGTRDGGMRDGGMRDGGMPDGGMRDAGRDAGHDAGYDAGAPGCTETFSGIDGFAQLCVEETDQCTMVFDRSGGLGSNQRSCADTCAIVGWRCVGSGAAGGGLGCATAYTTDCASPWNVQICLCSRF